MRLNTRGRYGLQLLSQLACHLDESKPVGLKEVAKATGLMEHQPGAVLCLQQVDQLDRRRSGYDLLDHGQKNPSLLSL